MLETPDGGLIDPRSPKVLPAGYALAADFPPDVDGTCQPGSVPTANPDANRDGDTATGRDGDTDAGRDVDADPDGHGHSRTVHVQRIAARSLPRACRSRGKPRSP